MTAPAPARQRGGGRHGDSGETVSIVASVPPTDHGWLGAISKNAQAQADQYDDVDFKLLEAADADSQAQQIEQVISEKPDVLVVLPQDGEALTPVAQKAEAPGSRSSTSTACSPSPTRRRRRSSATTTRSAFSRPTTSPRSSTARATSSRSRASPESRSPRTARKGSPTSSRRSAPTAAIEIVAQQPGDFNPDTA